MNNNYVGDNQGYIAGSPLWKLSFLSGYPLMIFLGLLASILTVVYFWKRQKYSFEILQVLIIIVVPAAVFGAKLYTMIVENDWSNPWELRGLSIYGALIFSIGSGLIYLYFKRKVIDLRTALSIILPTILIGQAIGRWGNFFNHEVYGRITSSAALNWMTFLKPQMYIYGPDGILAYRQPLFLYESLLSLLGYMVIVWILNDRNWLKPGATAAIYVAWYSIERLILQFFRDPSKMNTSYFPGTNVAVNLVVSIIGLILGLVLFIWWQVLTKPRSKWMDNIPTNVKPKWAKQSTSFILRKFSREYKMIKPKKMVRLLWVGSKYQRTFRIWLPVKAKTKKISKRKLNSSLNQKNKRGK